MRSTTLLATGLVWVAAGVASAATTVDVYVFDFDFSINLPAFQIEDPVIHVGDTIRWVWLDEMHNTVACVNQADFWESDVFMPGDTFVHTFDIPGVFQYYCAPHGHDNFDGTYSGMGGSVTVLDVPTPGGACMLALAALATLRRRRA